MKPLLNKDEILAYIHERVLEVGEIDEADRAIGHLKEIQQLQKFIENYI